MRAIDACAVFAARMTSPKKSRSTKSKRDDALVLCVLERVAAIFLRLGFDAPKAEYLLRSAFIRAARKIAESKDARSTQSQIALIAGVNRLDVRRLLSARFDTSFAREIDRQSRIERILEGWKHDPRFADVRGRPRPLSIVGRTCEFAKLTRVYGRDVTVRTLREMLVSNNLAIIKGNKIVLSESSSHETTAHVAGLSDLAFLSSQLASFDFHTGCRTFASRHSSLPAKDVKSLRLLQRKAVGKIESALGSLESVVLRPAAQRRGKSARGRRLIITTTFSSETDTCDPN
jgi:hypothetical protein